MAEHFSPLCFWDEKDERVLREVLLGVFKTLLEIYDGAFSRENSVEAKI